MKKTIFYLLCALTIISSPSCQKQAEQEPFWNSFKKFEFQNTAYVYTNGNNVEVIYISDYLEATPEKTTVQIFKGVIGGQKSFSQPVPEQNFLYISDSAEYTATFAFNDLKLQTANGIETIKTNITGTIQAAGTTGYKVNGKDANAFDYRKIASLTYQGKTFVPRDNDTYFIANKNEIGVAINRLITKDKMCGFTACLNGERQSITWNYSGDVITINAGNTTIAGRVYGTKYSTPVIKNTNGDVYIIQFYTLAANQQVACTCTMSFKLYKLVGGAGKTNTSQPQFQLVIGDC